MANRFGGVGTVVLAAAVATCGLFMLSGVGPSGANDVTLPTVGPSSTDADAVTSGPDPSPATTSTTSTSTTSTSTTSTTTSTTSTTTSTIPAPSPVPLSVTASINVVGAGGTVTFDGACGVGDDGPLGPVIVWVIGDSSDDIDVIDTGVSTATWTYVWSAPTDAAEFDSFTFQFWCGEPDGSDGYPAELQRRVDMVASAAPSTNPLVESEPPTATIPETD